MYIYPPSMFLLCNSCVGCLVGVEHYFPMYFTPKPSTTNVKMKKRALWHHIPNGTDLCAYPDDSKTSANWLCAIIPAYGSPYITFLTSTYTHTFFCVLVQVVLHAKFVRYFFEFKTDIFLSDHGVFAKKTYFTFMHMYRALSSDTTLFQCSFIILISSVGVHTSHGYLIMFHLSVCCVQYISDLSVHV